MQNRKDCGWVTRGAHEPLAGPATVFSNSTVGRSSSWFNGRRECCRPEGAAPGKATDRAAALAAHRSWRARGVLRVPGRRGKTPSRHWSFSDLHAVSRTGTGDRAGATDTAAWELAVCHPPSGGEGDPSFLKEVGEPTGTWASAPPGADSWGRGCFLGSRQLRLPF